MARDFGTNAAQKINATSPITAYPVTFACRINPDNLTEYHGGVGINDADPGGTSLTIEIDTPGGNLELNAGASSVATVAAATAGAWNNIVAVYTSATDRTGYINGTTGNNVVTSAVSIAFPTGTREFIIGYWTAGAAAAGDNINHQIADAAVWNAALAVDQVAAYIDGVSPLLIRPDALVGYWPLWGRNSPEPDLIGARSGTITNAATVTQSAHPPGRMPSRPLVSLQVAVATTDGAGAATGAGTASAIGSAISALVPDADITDGGWLTDTGGSSLFAAIDETPASDTDYIVSSDTDTDTCEIRLSDPSTTLARPFSVAYRYKRIGTDTPTLRVQLMEGATSRASWDVAVSSSTFIDGEQFLTAPEFATITDFTDLRVRFTAIRESALGLEGDFSGDLTLEGDFSGSLLLEGT